mmetsp:Transcript_14745/g.43254  ORF Transcript_14745/g.43254 Transcript_14745/m.43254 type:complete len:244 (-) Transcript_14745:277-1008(-)
MISSLGTTGRSCMERSRCSARKPATRQSSRSSRAAASWRGAGSLRARCLIATTGRCTSCPAPQWTKWLRSRPRTRRRGAVGRPTPSWCGPRVHTPRTTKSSTTSRHLPSASTTPATRACRTCRRATRASALISARSSWASSRVRRPRSCGWKRSSASRGRSSRRLASPTVRCGLFSRTATTITKLRWRTQRPRRARSCGRWRRRALCGGSLASIGTSAKPRSGETCPTCTCRRQQGRRRRARL